MKGKSLPEPGWRRAFTLVEVLVVIFIIGVLVAILLPAVQMARESARKTQCTNQMKQIVLASHQYHDAFGFFPAGSGSSNSYIRFRYGSMFIQLLPYLEQAPLFDKISDRFAGQPNALLPLHPEAAIPLPILACPSDPRTPGPQVISGENVSLTSYLGSAGTDYLKKDGIYFVDSNIRMSQILDGTSQTLTFGERPPSSDLVIGWWYAGIGINAQGTGEFLLGAAERNDNPSIPCPRGPYVFQKGKFSVQCDALHYWSPHPGGANFALADGSVRFITYGAADILPKLATRAGGDAAAVE